MPISPEKAHERAKKGAAGRNSPDSYLTSLERAHLTAEQKARIVALAMSFFGDREQAGGEAA